MASSMVCRQITADDVEDVKDILHWVFFGAENGDPISQVLKYDIPRETRCYVDGIMPNVLADGLSDVVIDTTSGKVVGIQVSHHVTRADTKELVLCKSDPDMSKMWITLDIVKQASKGINIFEKFQVSSYMQFLAIAVRPEYRRFGVAKLLIQESFRLAKAKGVTFAAATATSIYSKKVFDKFGFETIQEARYADYVVDGKPFASGSDIADHEYCSLCVKRFL